MNDLQIVKAALGEIVAVWDDQCGRVFESMGNENPRAQAISQAIEKARAVLLPSPPALSEIDPRWQDPLFNGDEKKHEGECPKSYGGHPCNCEGESK